MQNLKDTIKQINSDFLEEAKNSISLIEDMSAMERYLAESYNGRVFIELIQNADDCYSNKVSLSQENGHLFFANDGQPFDADDVISISRSGSSLKKRGENIGYRGVGFKSSTSLSNTIYIFSSDVVFTFSKNIAAKNLGLNIDKVPTVRIPFLVDCEDIDKEIIYAVNNYLNQGYQTVFVFENAEISNIQDEIRGISQELFIFLRNIDHCVIDVGDINTQLKMERFSDKGEEIFRYDDNSWKIIRNGSTALALKQRSGQIVACNDNEAVYHCFLPTLDSTSFAFKINADFSTDPSRKHITLDDISKNALKNISDLICSKITDILSGKTKSDPQFLSLLLEQKHFSLINRKLQSIIKEKLSNMIFFLANGDSILLPEYISLPNWLDPKEKEMLRIYSKVLEEISLPKEVYQNNYNVEEFLSQYTNNICENDVFIKLLEDSDLLSHLPKETISKITTKVIKKASLDKKLYDQDTNLTAMVNNLKEIDQSDGILQTVTEELSSADIEFVNSNTDIIITKDVQTDPKESKEEKASVPVKKQVKSSKPKVAKWRSAEQKVIQVEEFLGNKAEDVSKMNVGYDIESTTSSGEKRYIEVKLLKNDNSEFTITNNEYTAAHQYGDNYFICLVFEDKVIFVQNPLNKLNFTKRIRQWEWVCDEYVGFEIPFESE